MSKQIMKPVWRVNSGNGVPSDLGDKVIFTDGILAEPWDCDFTDKRQWELINNDPANYGAYRTTRTKAAKYERVECDKCGGNGALAFQKALGSSSIVIGSNWIEECKTCNGKGYTLEVIK